MIAEAMVLVLSQDLLERDAALRRRLAPAVELEGLPRPPAGLELAAGLPDFDLKRSFKSLYSRHLKEEDLDGLRASLQAELASSPLVLACYASPTVCDAIKHYRSTAQQWLSQELEGLRALEAAVGGVEREVKARAVQECLDHQARRGLALDEAARLCKAARHFRGVDGRPTLQVDVRKDLGLEGALVGDLRIGAGTLSSGETGAAAAGRFEERRRERLEEWRAALADPARGAPAGTLSEGELERVAAMDPARREAAARSIASAQALADLVREAHDAERRLESGELNAPPEVRAELARRREQLRAEVLRLSERFEAERRVAAAAAEAQAAAAEEVAAKARARLRPRRAGEARQDEDERLRPWGCEVKREERSGK